MEYIKAVFSVMSRTPQHIYQVLTKRSERLLELNEELNWTPNIWMGVSVENEKYSYRIDHLSATGACIKFLSLEPLIAPIKTLNLNKIHWVIVGGESGHNARPVKKGWIDYIKKQCEENNVAFFFKQWGKPKFNANPTDPTIESVHPQHAKGGCQLDGKVFRELPMMA